MPSCFFKGWAFGFYNVMLSGVFKAVLLGNTLQFRVIAEIFQGGFVVFQQQFSKVHFEAATTHNAHHHDVGGFTAESEGRNLPAAQTQTFREVVQGVSRIFTIFQLKQTAGMPSSGRPVQMNSYGPSLAISSAR